MIDITESQRAKSGDTIGIEDLDESADPNRRATSHTQQAFAMNRSTNQANVVRVQTEEPQ